MKRKVPEEALTLRVLRCWIVLVLSLALVLPGTVLPQDEDDDDDSPKKEEATKIPAVQLEALVAPIALYPDNLLSQVLVASTYPLEIVQLHQWVARNPAIVKDQKKLTEAVAKQPWDPSIQAMAALPDVVKFLAEDIQWTTDLGNAFLAQQTDVMDAVQRMRLKAKEKGT